MQSAREPGQPGEEKERTDSVALRRQHATGGWQTPGGRWRSCLEGIETGEGMQWAQLDGQLSLLLQIRSQQQGLHVEETLCKLNLSTNIKNIAQELSGWDKRNGFEISFSRRRTTPREAIRSWMGSSEDSSMILSRGGWKNLKTVGCAWNIKYGAHCWFSDRKAKQTNKPTKPSGPITFPLD